MKITTEAYERAAFLIERQYILEDIDVLAKKIQKAMNEKKTELEKGITNNRENVFIEK